MKIQPPLLFVILGLLAWAWLSETWEAAVLLLSIILFSQWGSLRWEITPHQFYRWGDLSSTLVISMVVYVYLIDVPQNQPIFSVLKWLPVLFAPTLFAQLFSQQQQLPLGTLFYSMRKRPNKMIDYRMPYASVTLLSVGAANYQGQGYYLMIVIFFMAMLWEGRTQKKSKMIWLALIMIAIMGGYLGHRGFKHFHYWLEDKTVEWFSTWGSNPFKGQTAIGDLGSLKLSDKIEFRVKSDHPLLLLQASYDVYLGKNWVTSRRVFSFENPVKNPNQHPLKKIEITQEFNRKKILALPDGSVDIQGLSGAILEYTELGTVKLSSAPNVGNYQVFYTGIRNDPPHDYDLKVPKQHEVDLRRFNKNLKLEGLNAQKMADKIKENFHNNFYYSLYLGDESDSNLALKTFMFDRKAGHCEYFAVATVLLLRQAGIPARLANGYVVDEYNSGEQRYIVRRRHAHAWAIAYIDGVWQAVDSTPSQWLAMESTNASWLQPINDSLSKLILMFKQWRIRRIEDESTPLWWGGVVLLLIYLLFRIYSARRQLTRQKIVVDNTSSRHQGLDSEFYLIEAHLKDTPDARDENESYPQWINRTHLLELKPLALLHYQLRFDPLGLTVKHRKDLQQAVSSWLNAPK
ncbi:MAG: transglutaminase family protein [Methylococcales bacterium]|nr:transglutaminase family protein [Methylococcales bacterium]